MRNLSILAVLGLTGCSILPVKWQGIWFLQVPVADPAACDFKGDENFDGASFPDDPGTIDTKWTITDDEQVSDSAVMIEIMKGHHGDLFLVMGDRVFPATSTAKSFTAIWDGTTDDTHEEKHDAGYDYHDDVSGDSTETLTLTRGAGGGFAGTWSLSSTFQEDYSETDQWKSSQVGLDVGRIPSFLYLTGKAPTNTANKQECGDKCTLSLKTTCDGSVDISAEYAGNYDEGEFAGIKGATQPPGAQEPQVPAGTTGTTIGGTTYFPYTSYTY